MENCLGGSKRTIRAQRDLQQLKQQCQQMPLNQNFYTQQQPQVHRQQAQTIKQQQLQLQQQLLQQQHQQQQQQYQQQHQHQHQHQQQLMDEEEELQRAAAQILHHHQQQQQQQQRLRQEEQELQRAAAQILQHHQQQQQKKQKQQLQLHQQHQLEQLIQPLQQLTLQQNQQQQLLEEQYQQEYEQEQLQLQQIHQQERDIAYQLAAAESEHNRFALTATTPKLVANCLHFPPPPDYPPPPPKTPTSTSTIVDTTNPTTTNTKTMSTTTNLKSATTPTTPVANKGNGIGEHNHQHQHKHHHHQHYYHEQQQQLQQQLQEQLFPTHQYSQQQQYQHHQQLTDNVLTHEEPLPPSAAISSVATHMTPPTNHNVTNNHHRHRHHSSASSSPSTSSATSGNTIGMSPYGRRHVIPRYPDPDPDAIEICNELEPINISKVSSRTHNSSGGSSSSSKTLGRITKDSHNSDTTQQWSGVQQTTSLQLLNQHNNHHSTHPHSQHDYSYAYYEPGAAMRHANIPTPEIVPGSTTNTTPNDTPPPLPPPPSSMRALLALGMKKKLLSSPAARHAYQTQHYGHECDIECDSASLRGCAGATNSENFYEEISSNEAALQYHYKNHHHHHHHNHNKLRASTTSHSAGSLNQSLTEEELRRIHTHHHKVLGELDLSVEAMLMPESPPKNSPISGTEEPTVSVTTASGKPNLSNASKVGCGGGSLRLPSTSTSTKNICDAHIAELLNTVGPTDELLSPVQSSTNAAFCAGDLDSGFSGSSGASYIGSLRIHKTNAALSHIMDTRETEDSMMGAVGGCSTSSMQSCNFSYGSQSCRSFQRSASTKQQSHQQTLDDDLNAGFLTRASCGRRILNCAKIRAAEDPGPVVQNESKVRSFWNSKGWRKLPGFSTSTSSINDSGIAGEAISMKNVNGDNTTIDMATAISASTASGATTASSSTTGRTRTKTKDTSTKEIPLICLKR